MMISQTGAVSASRLMAGGGIEAVESRVRQLESMIQQMEGTGKATKPFKAFLNKPDGAMDIPQPGAPKGPNTVQFSTEGITGSMRARFEAFQPLIEKYSSQYGVDKDLVNAVIRQESGFNPAAVSKAGARGLMQLMPGTARSLGVKDTTNPEQNIEGGVKLLKNLLETYHGNIPLALAAYNAGGGAVAKYKGIPPYKETQNYVKTILSGFLAQKQTDAHADAQTDAQADVQKQPAVRS